jgi:radical SAM protein with 4Fe4S-binding SPASM domain
VKTNISILPVMLRSTPAYVWPVAKLFVRKTLAELFEYRHRSDCSKQLALVTFRITPLCNLKCVMCCQRGKTGVLKGRYALEESKKIVPIQRYMELVDELRAVNPVFYVWGGEPFLYPGFMDLAAHMARRSGAFTVNTNGTYLAANAGRIVRDQWTGVYVSLDGTEEVNDAIRGKGTYRRVEESFEALNREKKRQGSRRPYLGMVTTISNLNYRHLEQTVLDARKFGLSWHMINLGTYTDKAAVERQQRFMKKTFGIEVNSMRGFLNGYNEGIDGAEFAEILARVQRLDCGYPVITVPVERADRIERYYTDFGASPHHYCICPWIHVDIDYNGDVHFCIDYPEYTIGNIREGRLLDIFNSEKAKAFRRKLVAAPDGMFPGCTRCYQHMLMGRANRRF